MTRRSKASESRRSPRRRGWELSQAVREILTGPRGKNVICTHFVIDEADIATNLRDPRVMIGSDGIPDLKGRPHPRLFGTMPRVLANTCARQRCLTRRGGPPHDEPAVDRFGLLSRGCDPRGLLRRCRPFQPRDGAGFRDLRRAANRSPPGIEMVIVNGQVAYEGGQAHGRWCGANAPLPPGRVGPPIYATPGA